MTTWYSRLFPDHTRTPITRLREDYLSLCLTQGLPSSAAVFALRDSGSSALTWFFSPETRILARMFQAVPCDKPAPAPEMTVCIGDEKSSWEVHFPWRARELKSAQQDAATVKEERRIDRQSPASLRYELNHDQLIALNNLEKFGCDLKFIRRPFPGRAVPFVFDIDRKRFFVMKNDGTLDENPQLHIRGPR